MQDRKSLLETVLQFRRPDMLDQLAVELQNFGWDSPEGELVNLTQDHLISILRRYIDGELSEKQVEDWANLVEMREDITFGTHGDEDLVKDVIHDLANPALEGPLTQQSANALLEKLDFRL